MLSTMDRSFFSYIFGILVAENILKLVKPGTHRHDWFIRPAEIDREMRKHGMVRMSLKGIGYNALRETFHLEDQILINYIVCYPKG